MQDLFKGIPIRIQEINDGVLHLTTHLSLEGHTPHYRKLLIDILPLLIDFGRIADVDFLCSSFLKKNASSLNEVIVLEQSKSPLHALEICRIYLIHIDLLKRRKCIEHEVILQQWINHPSLFIQGHTHSALGLLSVYLNDLSKAQSYFLKAEQLFRQISEPVDALKVAVRTITLMRMQGHYKDSQNACKNLLSEAKSLGIDALSPLLILYSTIGSNLIEMGHRYEALRYLRDAAKLSRAMPPSSASAYAFFHYGHALEQVGRRKEAVVWLEAAEIIQRPLDPVAASATFIALLRCDFAMHAWNNARQRMRMALANESAFLDADNARELLEVSFQISHALAQFEECQQLLNKAQAWQASFEGDKKNSASCAFEQSIQIWKIQLLETQSRSACLPALNNLCNNSPHALKKIKVDFSSGMLIGQNYAGQYTHISFRKKTHLEFLLSSLVLTRQNAGSELHLEVLQKSSKASKDAQSDSLRRKQDRVMFDLKKGGFVHERTKQGRVFFEFPGNCEIIVLSVRESSTQETDHDQSSLFASQETHISGFIPPL